MEKRELIEVLEEFGLSVNESKVYLACLELGLSKVNEIGIKAGIIRESTYGILNSLINKGIVSSVIKSNVKYFEATEPRNLKQILREKELLIEKVLPHLNELKKSKLKKPQIQFYQGKEGLKTIMEEILLAKNEVLAMVSNKNLTKLFEFYFPNFIRRREKARIKIRLLSDKKPFSKKYIQFKKLPKEFNFNTAHWIYEDKVIILSLNQKEPVGLLIEDKDIFNFQKNIFELLWRLLK